MGAATAAVLVRPSRAGWAASSGQFLTDFVAGMLISMVLFGMLPSAAPQQQEEEEEEQQGMVPNVVA
jgi:zinc transporter ZupT